MIDETDEAEGDQTTENERFYDAEIAPHLLALTKACQGRGIGFLAVVEYAPGETGRTASLPAGVCDTLRMTEASARCKGNIDALAFGWARYVRESGRGHDSVVLTSLGVPREREAPAA